MNPEVEVLAEYVANILRKLATKGIFTDDDIAEVMGMESKRQLDQWHLNRTGDSLGELRTL